MLALYSWRGVIEFGSTVCRSVLSINSHPPAPKASPTTVNHNAEYSFYLIGFEKSRGRRALLCSTFQQINCCCGRGNLTPGLWVSLSSCSGRWPDVWLRALIDPASQMWNTFTTLGRDAGRVLSLCVLIPVSKILF